MALLEVTNIDVFYGDFQALFGTTVHVNDGEVVAIIGANGAGKSSLLRAIIGLNAARRGSVTFDGRDITATRPDFIARGGIALVPEGRRLFGSLTVEENLMMGMVNGRKGAWNLEAVYDLFPVMREFRHRLPSQISGGQQQMVAVGRALMTNPRLLLCDELSLGLAPKIISDIYSCIVTIQTSGVSVLLVEQDIVRARAVSRRMYCLLEGCVSLHGDAATLSIDAIVHSYFGS